MNNKTVKIIIDNVEVEGRVTQRSEADINIEIIKPYKNISTGLHIPYFARSVHSFTGEYGDKTEKKLLKDLYEMCNYIAQNKNTLKEKLNLIKSKAVEPSSESAEQNNYKYLDPFFDDNFPMLISMDNRKEIIDILEGRKNLTNK